MTPITPDEASIDAWLSQAFSREQQNAYDDWKLGPVTRLLDHLGLRDLRPVTIAGTKGKGSTLAFLEAILLAHGRSTVAFTSPHVRNLTERWRLDGDPAPLADLAEACAHVAAAENATGCEGTYFERCFVIAAWLAQQRPAAIFLCEVGLGGRLDCANALDTRLAILTHLSRDHCAILGDTLEAIAGEKLAIARPDVPLLIAPQSAAAAAAIRSRLDPGLPDVGWLTRPEDAGHWDLGMAGDHQRDNAATALSAASLLLDEFDQTRARRALATVHLPARCQLIACGERRILVDGAHNGPSIAATMAAATACLRPGWQLILGIASDKDLGEVIAALPETVPIRRCGYAGPRCRRDADWPPAYRHWPWFHTVARALADCPTDADCCITGSFYLAGEALALLDSTARGSPPT